MRKYILITSGESIKSIFERSKAEDDNVVILSPPFKMNKFLNSIHKAQYRKGFRFFLKWIPNDFWKRKYILSQDHNIDKDDVIIIAPGLKAGEEINPAILNFYKKEYGVKIVLLLFDSLSSSSKDCGWVGVENSFNLFDSVFSFDLMDSVEYKIGHFYLPYKVVEKKIPTQNVTYDLFFVGNEKGRGAAINEISRICEMNNIKCEMIVVSNHKNFTKSTKNTSHSRCRIPYEEVISYIEKSNCILEMLCEGQNQASLRYYEAIAYNKKLLSNNKNIENMPYYNEKYMKYFRTIEDIDFEWIKDKQEIDYGYENTFSLKSLLKLIDNAV